MDNKLVVAIFAGGRGAASISQVLASHPKVDLKILVNAYDDGLSTGRLRTFIPGMLGPSDIRKNLARLIPDSSPYDRALRFLLEFRLRQDTSHQSGIELLQDLAALGTDLRDSQIAEQFSLLSLARAHKIADYCSTLLQYSARQAQQGIVFDFADCALGNLFFAGCFLMMEQDFNRAISEFSRFCGVPNCVFNMTSGEPLALTAVKEDGGILPTEEQIVSPQTASPIKDIFLLKENLTDDEVADLSKLSLDDIVRELNGRSSYPQINPEVKDILSRASLIIYGPGTQHSSLFPSYLTVGVGETIVQNQKAGKIFILNIRKDREIQSETTQSIVSKFFYYMNRKDFERFAPDSVVTQYFLQNPADALSGDVEDYVNCASAQLTFGPDKIVQLNWEAQRGIHLGGHVADELIAILNARAQAELKPSPYMVSIVVPALNEEKTVAGVLHELVLTNFADLGIDKEILFIDGGSTDHTYEQACSVKTVRAFKPDGLRGRGEAIRYGIAKARGNVIVFYPADAEYAAADLIPIVMAVVKNEFKVVFGSRLIKCVSLSEHIRGIYKGDYFGYLVSKYGGMTLSIVSFLLYNRFVSDPLTGIKAFDARLLRSLALKCNGLDLDTEIIGKLGIRSAFILEVPVFFKPRTRAEGKKSTLWGGLLALAALFRVWLTNKLFDHNNENSLDSRSCLQ